MQTVNAPKVAARLAGFQSGLHLNVAMTDARQCRGICPANWTPLSKADLSVLCIPLREPLRLVAAVGDYLAAQASLSLHAAHALGLSGRLWFR